MPGLKDVLGEILAAEGEKADNVNPGLIHPWLINRGGVPF